MRRCDRVTAGARAQTTGTLSLVDVATGRASRHYHGVVRDRFLVQPAFSFGARAAHGESAVIAATRADGGAIACGGEDCAVRLWHVDGRGEPARVLVGHAAHVGAVAWHPAHPRVLATGSDDRTVRVWA